MTVVLRPRVAELLAERIRTRAPRTFAQVLADEDEVELEEQEQVELAGPVVREAPVAGRPTGAEARERIAAIRFTPGYLGTSRQADGSFVTLTADERKALSDETLFLMRELEAQA